MADDLQADARPVEPSPHCLFSIDQVDAVYWRAHHIELFGNLIAHVLDGKEPENWAEELLELVTQTITDARTIKEVLEVGCHAAKRAAAITARR